MARSLEDIMATRQPNGQFGPKSKDEGEGDSSVVQKDEAAPPSVTQGQDEAADRSQVGVADAKPDGQQVKSDGKKPDQTGLPANQPDPEKNWTYAAYKDKSEQARKWRERALRLEQELAELRQKLPKQDVPDIFADPDGYRQHIVGELDDKLKKHQVNVSFRLAHAAHKDVFEEAYAAMIEFAENGDPSVVQGVYSSPDPGEALVTWYKRLKAHREIGDDPAAYKERVRNELREEIKAEILAELGQSGALNGQAPQMVQQQMPGNLVGKRSVGSRTGPAWSGPTPLADIFDRAHKARGVR